MAPDTGLRPIHPCCSCASFSWPERGALRKRGDGLYSVPVLGRASWLAQCYLLYSASMGPHASPVQLAQAHKKGCKWHSTVSTPTTQALLGDHHRPSSFPMPQHRMKQSRGTRTKSGCNQGTGSRGVSCAITTDAWGTRASAGGRIGLFVGWRCGPIEPFWFGLRLCMPLIMVRRWRTGAWGRGFSWI